MNLYENHCTKCHTSVVHVSEKRKAASLEEIEAYIRRWMAYEELTWTDDEIFGVLRHLNARYYRY